MAEWPYTSKITQKQEIKRDTCHTKWRLARQVPPFANMFCPNRIKLLFIFSVCLLPTHLFTYLKAKTISSTMIVEDRVARMVSRCRL